MSNALINGAAVHGKDGNRALHSHDEQWLEHMVHDLYQPVVDEPLPKSMLCTGACYPA